MPKLCEECYEPVSSLVKIGENTFCKQCIANNKFQKCPMQYCNNIISLNGYNDSYDIDILTCDLCGYIVCKDCLTAFKNIKYCVNCT
jgi:hypothetical protein